MARRKKKFKLDFIFVFIALIASIYLIYSFLLLGGIEDIVRYIVIALIIILDIYLVYSCIKRRRRRLKLPFRIFKRIVILAYALICLFIAYNISNIYAKLNDLNKDISKSTSLVTLKENKITKAEEIKDSTIGIIDMKDDLQAYRLPKEILNEYKLEKNNKIVSYTLYTEMIKALRDKKVNYIFLPTNYRDIYGQAEGYETLHEETKIIITKTKTVSKKESELLSTSKKITEPFSILLLGVDSATEGLKNADSFNGDSILLLTFNPKTLKATILSIPRDSYVPIACFPGRIDNKITHAAGYGTRCVVNTVSAFTGIKIDYYMKINFAGLVSLVDAVKGIDIDVPYAMCEQDSRRRFGKYTVYIESGPQHLNGEQALALSRNRKNNVGICRDKKYTQGIRSDFVRGANQQLVINAIINQARNIKNIDQATKIFDSLSKNIDTNMDTKTILSFYDVLKDISIKTKEHSSVLSFQRLELAGSSQIIYDERSKLELYEFVLNSSSIKDVSNEMKANLGLRKTSMIKSFSYTNGEKYEVKIIGKGPYALANRYTLLPDFTKMTKAQAETWAGDNNLEIIWEEVETEVTISGVILSQSHPVRKRVDLIEDKTITLRISKNIKEETKEEENEEITPPDDKKEPTLP